MCEVVQKFLLKHLAFEISKYSFYILKKPFWELYLYNRTGLQLIKIYKIESEKFFS